MKRSAPLKRSAPMRNTKPLVRQTEQKARAKVPVKRCKACRGAFTPASDMQTHCRAQACADALAAEVTQRRLRREAKERRQAEKLENESIRARKEALKGIPELKREAQQAFNAWVRYRDQGKGCFVCGAPLRLGGVGGGFDAGHIRSRSQADHLRYDERNVHGQCKPCNAPGATKDHEMRAAAERLLGKEMADALYADNRVIKWDRDWLRNIRDNYRNRVRHMKKERAQ